MIHLLPLYDRYCPVIQFIPDAGSEVPADYYVVKALAPSSLIGVLILLSAFSSPFNGVGHYFSDLLNFLAATSAEDGPYTLQSPSLQRLWDTYYVCMKRFNANQRNALWDNIRL